MQHAPRMLQKYFVNGARDLQTMSSNIIALISIGFIKILNTLDITSTGSSSAILIFYDISNVASSAWSLKNLLVSFNGYGICMQTIFNKKQSTI